MVGSYSNDDISLTVVISKTACIGYFLSCSNLFESEIGDPCHWHKCLILWIVRQVMLEYSHYDSQSDNQSHSTKTRCRLDVENCLNSTNSNLKFKFVGKWTVDDKYYRWRFLWQTNDMSWRPITMQVTIYVLLLVLLTSFTARNNLLRLSIWCLNLIFNDEYFLRLTNVRLVEGVFRVRCSYKFQCSSHNQSNELLKTMSNRQGGQPTNHSSHKKVLRNWNISTITDKTSWCQFVSIMIRILCVWLRQIPTVGKRMCCECVNVDYFFIVVVNEWQCEKCKTEDWRLLFIFHCLTHESAQHGGWSIVAENKIELNRTSHSTNFS